MAVQTDTIPPCLNFEADTIVQAEHSLLNTGIYSTRQSVKANINPLTYCMPLHQLLIPFRGTNDTIHPSCIQLVFIKIPKPLEPFL